MRQSHKKKTKESIPNIWNGTMFGDFDRSLNASRGFVSISWACSYSVQCKFRGKWL